MAAPTFSVKLQASALNAGKVKQQKPRIFAILAIGLLTSVKLQVKG